jgi:hypothetical protein
MKKYLVFAAAFAASVSLASIANASSITGFGDPLSNGALTGGIQQGFDGAASGLYNSITIAGVTYSGIGAPLNIGSDYNGDYNTSGGQSIFNGFDYTPSVFRFDFLSPVTAFAFNFGASNTSWLLQAFSAGGTLLDSLSIGQVVGSNAGDYFGLSTGSTIAYALLTENPSIGGDYVFIDRFTTNAVDGPSAVPVPAALPLLAAGLGALGLAGRRKRRNAAKAAS